MEVKKLETSEVKVKDLLKFIKEKIQGLVYLKQDNFKYFSHYPDYRDIEKLIDCKLDKEKSVKVSKRILGKSMIVQALFNGEKFLLPYMLVYTHNRSHTKNFGLPSSYSGGIGLWIGGKSPFGKPVLDLIDKPDKPQNVIVEIIWDKKENVIYIVDVKFGEIYPFFLLYKMLVKSNFDKLYKNLSPETDKFSFYQHCGCVVSIFVPENCLPAPVIFERKFNWIELTGVENKKKKIATKNPVAVIGGFGKTPKGAEKSCYNNIRNVFIPNCYFRTDIGQAWYKTKYPAL